MNRQPWTVCGVVCGGVLVPVWMVVLVVLVAVSAVFAQPPQPQAPVYIEDSPAAQDLIDEAHHLRRQDRLAEAAAKYQQVVEQYAQKLMVVSPQLYTDMSRWVRQQIAADAPLLSAYRRAYEATAQRALKQACEPEVDAAALAEVLRCYALCDAGLEAGLRLAGLALERGDGVEAITLLDDLQDHPNLSQRLPRWHQLQAMAAALCGQTQRQKRHTEKLAATRDRQAQAELAGWTQDLQRPSDQAAAPVQQVELPKVVSRPLWTVNTQMSQQSLEAVNPEQREAILPMVQDSRLYINDGLSIMSIDRSSGRTVWHHRVEDDEGTPLGLNNLNRLGVPDQRGVGLEGSALAGVIGRLGPMRTIQITQRGHPTRLLCLNASDGALRWQRNPGQLDDTLSNSFFHGTPIIAHGRVFVLARRSQMSGFQDAFLLAISVHDGKLLWRRHLSSSVVTNRVNMQSLSQMTLEDGLIYVADNLGSAACVNARDGEIRWLTVLADVSRLAREQPFQLTPTDTQWPGPVRVEAGLLVPASNGTVLVLDPQNGKVLRELKEPLATSQYLIAAGADVLGIGSTVSLLDGATLQVRWRRKVAASEDPAAPVGRGFVAGQRLVLPMASRLLVLDLGDGAILAEYPLDGAGNVLALPDQLLLASRGSVRCYMAWDDAQRALQAQIQAEPSNPEPALALAHLALSGGRPEPMLAAVDQALAALQRCRAQQPQGAADEMQTRVLEQLMGFTQAATLEVRLRHALFDRIATVTAGPADEVAYQLSFGRFLEEIGQPQDAVGHYQAVLSDAVLSRQLYKQAHGARQAGLEATLRLKHMVKQHGPEIYATQQTLAQQRLAQLVDDAGAPVAALIDLARQYPLSTVAPAALSEAAARLMRSGDYKSAVTLLRRAYSQSQHDPQLLARVVGQIVTAYQEHNQPRQARRWLRRAAREYQGIAPIRDGRAVEVEAWLAELSARVDAQGNLPSLSLPLRQPMLIAGRLLTLPANQANDAPNDVIVTVSGLDAQFRRAPNFDVAWQVRVPEPNVQLLSLTSRQTLLWSASSGTLMAVQNDTGQASWPTINAQTLIKELGGEAERQAARPQEQRQFIADLNPLGQVIRGGKVGPLIQPPPPGFRAAVNDTVICVSDLGGRVVGISRDNGQVLWRSICHMDELSFMQMSDDSLALAGVMDPGTHDASGVVMVLDPLTGEPRLPQIDEKYSPVWLGIGGDGLLLYATSTEVVAHHLDDGELAWRLGSQDNPSTGQGEVGFDSMILRQTSQRGISEAVLLVVDPLAGEMVERLHLVLRPDEPVQLRGVDDLWHLLVERQVMALDGRGRLLWRDAIAQEPQSLLMQLIGERHLVVLGLQGDSPDRRDLQRRIQMVQERMDGGEARWPGREPEAGEPGAIPGSGGWEYQLYILDRRGGAIIEQRMLGPLREAIDHRLGLFLDHVLILGGATTTLVIPDSSSGAGK